MPRMTLPSYSSGSRASDGAASAAHAGAHRSTHELPEHLREWHLPPGWRWGTEGVWLGGERFSMEVIDSLDRSLSLVTAPDPAHAPWLFSEARHLGKLHHRAVPTTYHVWTSFGESRRGPGYLRHWIEGESLRSRLLRQGPDDIRTSIRLLREVGSMLSYLHASGRVHGAISSDDLLITPIGELWMLGWQWAVPRADIPDGLEPDARWRLSAPEWGDGWAPTPASDQWQLAALCLTSLTAEHPPSRALPPVKLVRPECPEALAYVLEKALSEDPTRRYASVTAMLRDLDRYFGVRPSGGGPLTSGAVPAVRLPREGTEEYLRFALGDDYELLAKLGRGSFGDVWRARDLALEREVALKILHPHVAEDAQAMTYFRREARLAAQLSHPSIVPIYDWDSRAGVAWFVMELMENGSLADLVKRSGPRPLGEVAPAIGGLLDGLSAAHTVGILHRDLKPENILIDRWRRWRIGDFGLASREGQDKTGVSGTPAFAAPEQFLNEHQSPAVDTFAMAAITLYACTGRLPFGDGDPRTVLARRLARSYDVGELPPAIGAWVARGLDPEPDKRWPDARAMRQEWLRAVAIDRAALMASSDAPDPATDTQAWWRQLLGR